MSRHIAQVAPRRASNALIRELLQQIHVIDAEAAKDIAHSHLRRQLAQVLDAQWNGLITDDEFAKTYLASIGVLVQHSARRESRPPMTKVEYDLLCHCVITSESLRQVIERHSAFLGMLDGRGAVMSLAVNDGIAEYTQSTEHRTRDKIAMFADLAGITANYRLFAWLVDLPFELVEVKLCYPPLVGEEAVSFLMPFPITYNTANTAFCFDAELLDRPVVRTPQQLNRLLARFPFDVDDTRGPRVVLTERVRAVLVGNMSAISKLQTEQHVAETLGISLATLKRRLKAEQTSFRQIRDVLLRTIAIDNLKGGVTSIEAIANRLGFGDTASFRHAFKRWTGHSPSYYQRPEQPDSLAIRRYPGGRAM